jgi:dipeptidyl aminopeptidase/acylaminoacyl peptidase
VLIGAVVAGGFVVAAVAFAYTPGLTLALGLAAPAAERWLTPLLHEVTREEIVITADGGQLRADLYQPTRARSAMLLVHGLSASGRRQPDLERLARLLAREGQLVLVPEFSGLAAFRLTGREVTEIQAALTHLVDRHGSAGVAGFSFGAGPALLAAATVPRLRVVGSFGGYADLRNVIRFITTGAHTLDGRRYVQPQQEYNRWKLLALLAGFVADEGEHRLLETIARRRLENPPGDVATLERDLRGDGRRILALALNRDEGAVDALLAALPAEARRALDALAPLPVVSRLPGRILIAHGAGDDSIPFTESLRLAAATGRRARLAILHTFHHTGPRPFWESLGERAQDGYNLVRIAGDLLARD